MPLFSIAILYCLINLISPLLSLYSQKERRQLSLTYHIPPHIAVILRQLSVHNNHDFPHSTDRWSFADSVHPAVRLALYYSE